MLFKFKQFLLRKNTVIGLYILLAFAASFKQYAKGYYNNYLIFKYHYIHSINFENLFKAYPEYLDVNHYGPFFALIIAPFAILPDYLGLFLWNFFNVGILLYGIFQLPLSEVKKVIIAWIVAHETLTALFSFQFNIMLTGLLLLSFAYLLKQKEIQSAFAIIIGFLVKLYGIVGLAFFFFAKDKLKFILAGIAALIICFLLPMALSSPAFVIQSYQDWFRELMIKNGQNTSLDSYQDISLMGIVRRIMGDTSIQNTPFLLSGLLLFALPYIRIKQYAYLGFRLMLLASTLIFTVIFSSGSESPTYVIAFAGVAIWFIIQPQPKNFMVIALFIFAFLITSMSPSDLFPKFIREQYIQKYSLKALPCVFIWLHIVYQMLKEDFSTYKI